MKYINLLFLLILVNCGESASEKKSRITIEEKQQKEELIDISEVIKNVSKFSKSRYPKIEFKYSDNKNPLNIFGNKYKFSMVIYNLLNNAAYAIQQKEKKGNGVININAENTNNKIILTVEDNGIGISNDIKEKIFDLGFTTKEKDESTPKEKKGSGIGLYVAHAIIYNSFYGEIHVTSTKNIGTKFTITIQQ